jgi:hypothetical protein
LARLLALVGLAPNVAVVLVDAVAPGRPALNSMLHLLLNALVVLALRAYGPDSRPVRGPWLAALAIGVAPVMALQLVPMFVFERPLLDGPAFICVLFVAAAAGYLVRRIHLGTAHRSEPPGTPLALALLAGIVLGFRLLTLLEYLVFTSQERAAWIAAGALEALAVLGVGVPLVVLAAGALHRLAAPGGDPT